MTDRDQTRPAAAEHAPAAPLAGELVDADHDGLPDTHHGGPASPGGGLAKRADNAPTVPMLNGVPMTRREPIDAIGRLLPPRAAAVVVRTKHVVTHQHTRTTGKALVRNAFVYPAQGAGIVLQRWRDAHGASRYERQMRAAEADRDQERLRYWHEAGVAEKQRRHQRVMDWLDSPAKLAKAVGIGISALVGLLLTLGIVLALADKNASQILGPISGVLDAIQWTAWFLAAYGALLLTLATASAITYLWHLGRTSGNVPTWLTPAGEQQDSEIDERTVTQALAHVGIPKLTKFLKGGGKLEFLVAPREQGGGTYMQIRLCLGVVAADLLDEKKIERLAGNLSRHKHETYPQRDPKSDARVLDLWVADKGAMDRPAPPWPLLDEGEFDVFRDELPLGVTMRGEYIGVSMLQKHWFIGATSKQGKTTVVRLDLLALALDPTVELRIADLKGDGDLSMFAPRATVLIEGQGAENEVATCEMLEAGVAEYKRRYDRKRELGIKGSITRELSRRKGSGFHPLYLVVDECQVLYGAEHPIGGTKNDARAWKAAKALHDQARAVNVHLIQATQRPDNRTLPVQVREGPHVRAALCVPNESAARMILADAVDRGARPQDLRYGIDRGKIVLTGEVEAIPPGQAFLLLQTHYVDTQDAYRVIARAMEIMERHGRTVEPTVVEAPVERDFLTDLEVAMQGEVRVRTIVLLARLAQLDHSYEDWDYDRLNAALARFPTGPGPDGELVPLAPYKTSGKMHVGAAHVEAALLWRREGGGDAGGKT